MGTPATGELRPLAHGFEARIRIKGKIRRGFDLLGVGKDETAARERCAAMAAIAVRLRKAGRADKTEDLLRMAAKARAGRSWEAVLAAVATLTTEGGATPFDGGPTVPTLGEHIKAWAGGELAKKYPHHVKVKRSASDDAGRAKKHIPEHIADVPVNEITLDHCEMVVANLDEKASGGTRRQVAQLLRKALALAVYPCRYRTDHPVPRGWLPSGKSAKAKECLYPDEDRALLACTGVRLLRRLAYGFLDREGMRREEMAELLWQSVDLVRGKIYLDENKTDDPRDWDLDPGVALALQAWKERYCPDAKPTDRVFAEKGVALSVDHLAEQFRRDLQTAGVSRPQLFERSAARQPIRVHDLRSTFITTALATGKTETWVADRTGHRSSQQIGAYRRKARTWAGMELGTLGSLYYSLPDFRKALRQAPTPTKGSVPHAVPQKHLAKVAELADAPDSGSGGVNPVGVQVPSFALCRNASAFRSLSGSPRGSLPMRHSRFAQPPSGCDRCWRARSRLRAGSSARSGWWL